MARRAATQGVRSGRRSEGNASPAATRSGRLRLALYVVLALSAAISLAVLYIHAQLASTHGAYTSFCNVSARVNCDAVLTSRFSALLGFPLAGWALLTYGVLVGMVAWQGRASGPARTQATLLLLGASLWTCAFSLYMATIALAVIGTLCLLCSGMYLLGIALAVLAWSLARAEIGGPLLTAGRLGIGAAGIVVSLALIAGAQFTALSADVPVTADDVRTVDPEFYRWYTSQPVVDLLPSSTHVKGSPSAPITIIEFSDFECTHCGKAFRDLRDLLRRHPDSVRIVFHHFPLDTACNPKIEGTLHHNACLAAVAAECAARYGRFWEYHDALFEAQDRLARDQLIAQAVALGIDRTAFTSCLSDPERMARVRNDIDAGARLGVVSTPTLFINGRTVKGALERQAYEYVIAMERRS